MSDKLKLGILTSGNQSNARLIIKACLEDRINADVPIIISDDANSGASDDVNSEAIDKVSESNQNQAISSKNSVLQQNLLSLIAGERRLSDESDILQEMVNSKIDLIVLVGYVRKLTPEFFNLYNNKIVDLFPADTRKYRGVNAYEWAWLNKLNATCATVYFVESLNNTGPIILQAPIQIKPEYGSLEEFKNVGFEVEHKLYPLALQMLVNGQIELIGDKVNLLNNEGYSVHKGITLSGVIERISKEDLIFVKYRTDLNHLKVSKLANSKTEIVYQASFGYESHKFLHFTSLMGQVQDVRDKGYQCELNFDGMRFA